MAFDAIQAQASAVRTLQRAAQNGKIAQSYLFTGPGGVGKQLTAMCLVRAALCEQAPGVGCGACDICTRIDAGNHPDVRIFEPREDGNRNLQVEFLRNEVLPFTKFAPFEARAAFLIFASADISFPARHAESANALLKTLEEPRPGVHFVLLSERPERLLTTIRSRCQRVRFSPLPMAVLESILRERGVAPDVLRPAAALASGRADRALELSEEGRAEAIFGQAEALADAVGAGDLGPLLDLAENLAGADERAALLESLSLYYRDVASAALGMDDAQLCFAHRADAIRQRAGGLTAGAAARNVARIEAANEHLARNANPQLAMDALLLSMDGS